ncbi:hypothetical protein [Hoeflea sp.]|uniref:hypothetical protein n=1 Tax=Hoeflea sp. TaxID=1940281 RepID=UPI0019B6BD35|nr:hypothetical protein [Hoeflea sp.]MBC7283698.1 hypothetical protein [Hoeflea sp.]
MFGFSLIARKARLWRAQQQRAALESLLMNLPRELQKDIGWPAPREMPSLRSPQTGIDVHPML